jgi:hypothetical protein
MAAYYARRIRWGPAVSEEFWRVDVRELSRIDVVSGSGMSVFPREAGEPVSSILERAAPHGEWYKLQNQPGEYYARMARPTGINEEGPGRNPDPSDEFRYYRARSAGQLYAFIQELDDVCRVVHPEANNLFAFGHAIRNILILACTEVEAHWKAVLESNSYKGAHKSDRLNTNDYVKLLQAMRLDQYVVNLNFYPWLPTISPFTSWSHRRPTASLPWYQTCNQVKHDRERHFKPPSVTH